VTTGADPKKLTILGVLFAIMAVVVYMNFFSGDSESPASPPRAVAAIPAAAPAAARQPATSGPRRTTRGSSAGTEIKFRQGTLRPEDRPDPATINPTLRLDLLAKVQNVQPEEAMRNLFQYGAAPPPPSAKPLDLPKNTPKIPINHLLATATPPRASGPPPPPSAPKMTFKYYGYEVTKSDGRKQAFLLDGDDIIIAGENANVKNGRYKVVKIGVNSITIEDTQFKSTQTLPLQQDANA